MKTIILLLACSICYAERLPVHWPSFVYFCQHWCETDHLGNSVGYNFGMFAKLCDPNGEFLMQVGRDAGHYERNRKRQIVWVPEPNVVMAELVELKSSWDSEKWFHYVNGELYIAPSLADANEVATEWINK